MSGQRLGQMSGQRSGRRSRQRLGQTSQVRSRGSEVAGQKSGQILKVAGQRLGLKSE